MGDVPSDVFIAFWFMASLFTVPLVWLLIFICQVLFGFFVGLDITIILLYGLIVGWFVAFNYSLSIRC